MDSATYSPLDVTYSSVKQAKLDREGKSDFEKLAYFERCRDFAEAELLMGELLGNDYAAKENPQLWVSFATYIQQERFKKELSLPDRLSV